MAFDLRNGPFPEFDRNHLCHIATEAVYTFSGPKQQNVTHLKPRGRYRVEVPSPSVTIIYSVVQFYRFVPVVASGRGGKIVIACGFGRTLFVWDRCTALQIEAGLKRVSGNVIEVVLGREG